jgi:hypothetical protein
MPSTDTDSFSLEKFLADRRDLQNQLAEDLADELAAGGLIIERTNGQKQILWSLRGTRHSYDSGETWGALDRPFVPEAMTPNYLGEHIANRCFGFGWELASVVDRQTLVITSNQTA